MKAIIYRVVLLEPTLVTALDGDPNSAVAFDYLPGSALRGAVIRRYMRHHGLSTLDLAAPGIRRLFFGGTTRYLNGYLLDHNGRRTLPSPLSWQHPKGEEARLFDHALEPPEESDETSREHFRPPFCSVADGYAYRIRPARHVAVHTARTRRFGRAMPQNRIEKDDNPGAVYRYDALAQGQTFEAALLCESDEDAAKLLSLLDGEATLGGSRSGGYGRVRLQVRAEKADWREVDTPRSREVNGKLVVTLASDALVRDEQGHFSPDPEALTRALEERLGVSLKLRDVFLRSSPVGGFNRTWGLPLPQALATAMGSVLVYDPPNCDAEKLSQLQAVGIGERRAEGFGRVVVNWQTEQKLAATDPVPEPRPGVAITDSESRKLAERMARRMLRRFLDLRLVHAAGTRDVVDPPSSAQLSRLRDILRDELMKEKPGIERIDAYRESVKARSTPRGQFEKARIGETSLLAWLEDTLGKTDDDNWGRLLGIGDRDFPAIGGVRPQVDDSLRVEYILRFIDAVLARAAKKRQQAGGRQEGG